MECPYVVLFQWFSVSLQHQSDMCGEENGRIIALHTLTRCISSICSQILKCLHSLSQYNISHPLIHQKVILERNEASVSGHGLCKKYLINLCFILRTQPIMLLSKLQTNLSSTKCGMYLSFWQDGVVWQFVCDT